MKRVAIVVTGNVQGVFYRASAKETAGQLNVKGFAQNQADGSVYIEAEGDEEKLKQFIAWCKQGSPRAAVTAVTVQDREVKNFTEFEIRR